MHKRNLAARAGLWSASHRKKAILGWLLVEVVRDKHATTVGGASGAIAGLVAITPACAAVSPLGAIVVGLVAGVLCALAVGLKYKLGYDDSLDVVGVHLVGGLWGTIAIGFLLSPDSPAGLSYEKSGLFYGGGVDQLWRQVVGALAVLAYSFVLTLLIGFILQKTVGFRLDEEDEMAGVDNAEHAETAYDLGNLTSSLRGALAGSTAPRRADGDINHDEEATA